MTRRRVGRMWARRAIGWLQRRRAVVPLLVLGAVLIAVAAGPKPAEGSWTGLPDASVLRLVVGAVVAILCTFGLIILLATRTVSNPGERKRRNWFTLLGAFLLVGILVGMFSLIDFEGELPPEEEQTEPPAAGAGPVGEGIEPGPGFEATDVTALIAILVVAIILLIWTRRSLATLVLNEIDEGESALEASLGRARDHLLDGDDPRQAVMLAYRDLERTLEALDLPRRESETPTEHLDRALAALSITKRDQAGPLRDLAGLYARARYSDHRITKAEQRRAGESLGLARHRLVGAD